MLDPEYLLHISEGAEDIAEQLHSDIIARVIERMMIRLGNGEEYLLTSADKWRLQTLQDAGYLLEDIQAEIASKTKLQIEEIKEAMEEAGVKAISYDDKIYQAAGLSPTALEQSPSLVRIMQINYDATIGEWTNFTQTMATATQRNFITSLDKAFTLVSTGALSYTEAVKEAVNEMIRSGAEVLYSSGRSDSIETATLRAVRTGISQMSGQIQIARMDEMDCDLVLVSSHLGARPEHQEWQGKVYSRSGKSSKYPDFVDSTKYGSVTGLCGANCRHNFGPYFEGMDNPFDDYDSEDNLKAYEEQQRQRELERRIRNTKREVMGLRNAIDNAKSNDLKLSLQEAYERKAVLLKRQNDAYTMFCEEHNLKKLRDRISIARWDRKQATAARNAGNSYHKKWLKGIGAETSSLNTLDKFYKSKYNGTDEYVLLNGYNKATKKGDISPLIGFEQYKEMAKEIDRALIGQTTNNGVKIESYTTHFIDRIIGQVSEPHEGKRQGVSVEEVLDALINPDKITDVRKMADGDLRQMFENSKAKVSISIRDKRLIQANPRGNKHGKDE